MEYTVMGLGCRSTTPPRRGLYTRQKGNAMNLLSFLLILSVDLVLREELLTYALIIWGTVLVGRYFLRLYIPHNRNNTRQRDENQCECLCKLLILNRCILHRQ